MDRFAAATYVSITREEFEDWLNSVKRVLHTPWVRVQGKAGVYIIKFSDNVGLRVSSSIGRKDEGMRSGKAAIHFALVSMVDDRVINKKALGQSRFNRTTNWRENLLKGVRTMKAAYNKAQNFYEEIALKPRNRPSRLNPMGPQDEVDFHTEGTYQVLTREMRDHYLRNKDVWERIEALPGWANNSFLKSLHTQAKTPRKNISDRQIDALAKVERSWGKGNDDGWAEKKQIVLEQIEALPGWEDNAFLKSLHDQAQRRPLSQKQLDALKKTVSRPTPVVDEKLLGRLRKLWSAANTANDERTKAFAHSLADHLKRRGMLTSGQTTAVEQAFRRYKVASIADLILRKQIIRLAYLKPALRRELLPLVM